MTNLDLRVGDCLESLRALPDGCVNTCVTSPPYFGLRDYGHDGQIGLEDTPDAYVAKLVEVFREVRRVLRDDGTLWLNLGDSYAGTGKTGGGEDGARRGADGYGGSSPNGKGTWWSPRGTGLKVKDLIGVPWRVAFALQQPYYAGRIKNEMDRVWLAAMLDGEGCFYIHRRLAGQHAGAGYFRQADNYQCAFEVANTSEAIVQRCLDITGVGSIIRQDKDRRQPLFRWTVRSNEAKALIREVYPYLVAKQQQARIAFGITASGKDAEPGWQAMKALHSGSTTDVDYPAPPSCHEPGWYLCQDVIWSKPNPMPESVRDRCTKAHEYIFLLSKGPRYYFDAEAIAQPLAETSKLRLSQKTLAEQAGSDRVPGKTNGRMKAVGPRFGGAKYGDSADEMHRTKSGNEWKGSTGKANRRSVWTVTTKPFKGAHFATFPPDLIEPCILAGSPEGGTVLDPFGGSGTTAGVALAKGRKAILCELNPAYAKLIPVRVHSIMDEMGQIDLFAGAAE